MTILFVGVTIITGLVDVGDWATVSVGVGLGVCVAAGVRVRANRLPIRSFPGPNPQMNAAVSARTTIVTTMMRPAGIAGLGGGKW